MQGTQFNLPFEYDARVLDGVVSEPMMVSPELAAKWLEKNVNNRNLNKATVAKYVASMKSGEWMLNGEAICFDKQGGLINGQHRLQAVCLFGQSVPFMVTRGIERKAFVTYDNGRLRTPGEMLHSATQCSNYNSCAAAVKSALLLNRGVINFGSLSTAITRQEIIGYYMEHGELIQALLKKTYPVWNERVIENRIITGAMLHAVVDRGHTLEDVENFVEQLMNPAKCKMVIIGLLYRALYKNVFATKKITREQKFRLLIKTWNCYISGSDKNVLRIDPCDKDIML